MTNATRTQHEECFAQERVELGETPAHVEPMMIPLIKEKYNCKSHEYFVNLKLRRDPMYIISDLYEFKMYFFYHGNPKEFLLFIHNFNMNITATGMLKMDAKIQYLRMLVREEALRQVDLLSGDVEIIETLNMD